MLERGPLPLTADRFEIFRRVQAEGPRLTLLHSLPTSSFDYAGLVPALGRQQRRLLFDFLGVGDSDTPAGHSYSLFAEA